MPLRLKFSYFLLYLFLGLQYSVIGADYYWIGGSGDWSEISHWATTSGGAITHEQTPTADDNVYFDANSFTAPGQVITINGEIAFSHHLRFLDPSFTPTFRGENNTTLTVFGDLELIPDIIFDFTGNLIFASQTTGATIDLAGHEAGRNVTFDGAGSWTLESDLIMTNDLNIKRGEINFKNARVSCLYFRSRTQSRRVISLGNSQLTIAGRTIDNGFVGSPFNVYSVNVIGNNLTINGDNSHVVLTATSSKILIEGPGNITFHDLTFLSPSGISELNNYRGLATINITGLADLRHNTNLLTNATIDSIKLYQSFTYQLQAASTVATNHIEAIGDCISPIFLTSSNAGQACTINALQALEIQYVSMRDIHVTNQLGSANNSIDLGNNTGWTITSKTSEDLYWIGGTGNWDDPSHWSLSSGGTPLGCIPTLVDNVIFDQNSFTAADQSVNINVLRATCKDMTWTNVIGNPRLIGPAENAFLINGSLQFDRAMSHDFEGDYYYISPEQGNTITTAGQPFNDDIYFDNPNGGWMFSDSIYVDFSIFLVNGNLNTNDQYIEAHRFNSDFESNPRTLNLTNSTIYIVQHGSELSWWLINNRNLNFDAGTSHIIINSWYSDFSIAGDRPTHYHRVSNLFTRSFVRNNMRPDILLSFNYLAFDKDGEVSGTDINIDTLKVKNGFSYFFSNNIDLNIGEIVSDDPCEGLITFSNYSYSPDPVKINLSGNTNLTHFSFKGISFINPGGVAATSSIDGGDNTNITFTAPLSRQLYWVGGAGNWDDPAHWSLSSGGTGGECIPTVVDDVFFDDNSFLTLNDNINNENLNAGYCHDINFSVANFSGGVNLISLYVHGDVNFSAPWAIRTQLRMENNNEDQNITSSGTTFSSLSFNTTRTIKAHDDLFVEFSLNVENSITLDLRNVNITADRMGIYNNIPDMPSTFLFDATHIKLNGNIESFSYPLGLNSQAGTIVNTGAGGLKIEFTNTNTGTEIRGGSLGGNFLFSNSSGTSTINLIDDVICNLQKLEFKNNGKIVGKGSVITDTLLFTSGKSYQFASGQTQTINNYFQARGNNCIPIEWGSTATGSRANVKFEQGARIDMDFVEMRDLASVGGSNINAGSHSTNIANSNTGFIFPTPTAQTESEGFFGPDIVTCDDRFITLKPFDSAAVSSIRWSTGATNLSIDITENSTIGALVTFANNCTISDTVNVSFEESFSISLGSDTILCEGQSLFLNPSIANASYLWQDSTTSPSYQVTSDGLYAVDVTIGSCFASDSIQVDYVQRPDIDLSTDLTACMGDTLVIDATVAEQASYSWSTGATSPMINASSSGEYYVTITTASCAITDTAFLEIYNLPEIQDFQDTSICEGTTLSVGPLNEQAVQYLWNTGATSKSIDVKEQGRYVLTITDTNGCMNSDSFELFVLPIPVFELGGDSVICEGTDIRIGTNENYDFFLWNTGEQLSHITVDQSGSYTLTSVQDGCSFSDTVDIEVQALPVVDLGVDQTICDGEEVQLDVTQEGATYSWSTNELTGSVITNQGGTYAVTVTIQGCRQEDQITISTKPTPFFDLGNDINICEGERTTISALVDDTWTLNWSTGEKTASIEVNQSGSYVLSANLDGCEFSDDVSITVHPIPVFDLGPDQSKCEDNTLLLQVPLNDVSVIWQDGSDNRSFLVQQGGSYSASVISAAGCNYEDEIFITDETCTKFSIYTPTAFSPNNDGINDRYSISIPPTITVLEYEMHIYDRWGGELFKTTDIGMSWDGFVNNQKALPGNYSVAIRIRYDDDFEKNRLDYFTQTFTLID